MFHKINKKNIKEKINFPTENYTTSHIKSSYTIFQKKTAKVHGRNEVNKFFLFVIFL